MKASRPNQAPRKLAADPAARATLNPGWEWPMAYQLQRLSKPRLDVWASLGWPP